MVVAINPVLVLVWQFGVWSHDVLVVSISMVSVMSIMMSVVAIIESKRWIWLVEDSVVSMVGIIMKGQVEADITSLIWVSVGWV